MAVPGIVYEHVESAKSGYRLFNGSLSGLGISGVRPESRSPFRRRVQSP